MAKRYLINIFLLIAVLCGFSSCEEDPYYDPYEEITYDLWLILNLERTLFIRHQNGCLTKNCY